MKAQFARKPWNQNEIKLMKVVKSKSKWKQLSYWVKWHENNKVESQRKLTRKTKLKLTKCKNEIKGTKKT